MLSDVVYCHEMHSMLSVNVVHRFRFVYVNPQTLGETLDVVLEVSTLVCHTARLLSPLSSSSSYFSNSSEFKQI